MAHLHAGHCQPRLALIRIYASKLWLYRRCFLACVKTMSVCQRLLNNHHDRPVSDRVSGKPASTITAVYVFTEVHNP